NSESHLKSTQSSALKLSEIDFYDEKELEDEKNEMLKELTRLMYEASIKSTNEDTNNHNIKDLTNKRKQTLKLMMNTQILGKEENSNIKSKSYKNGHTRSLSIGLSELLDNSKENEDLDYDLDIFRTLENFMGNETSFQDINNVPHTPSTSKHLQNIWS